MNRMTPMINEPQFLYVTTTGHRSGKPHEIEIWFVEYAGAFYIVAENRERAHWVQNIRRTPTVTVRLGDQIFPATGRAINADSEPGLAESVSRLMDAKYGWSDGLIVELSPDSN
jgi:deazaflavin-dependent oxidoreductase (nitroreductase family)